MNHLNSILIEGVISADAKLNGNVAMFHVESHRYVKTDDGFEKHTNYFDIETNVIIERLAEKCIEKVKKGREVRIVGYLKQNYLDDESRSQSKIIIVAENVEIKPGNYKPNDKEV